MRERTPLTADIIGRLPALKLIASTGPRNASIDVGAARARGIEIVNTGYNSYPTIELTWGLILARQQEEVANQNADRASKRAPRSVKGLPARARVVSLPRCGELASAAMPSSLTWLCSSPRVVSRASERESARDFTPASPIRSRCR